ncbi:RNA polymerase sigma factor [Steroidobacter cummioxidans]|uniref:RNA polymerase sigma factor n=1 Tax=Steroidobacter cummioxidans TaxID=1803913 RepID=UPI000E31FC72|nr:sigma-70 family RNA polymerase sigma factor [Steroidobacter cummioxidans]
MPKPDPLVQRFATTFGADFLRFLGRRVRNRADARDVAQEAYVRLLRLDRKELIRDPQPYIYRLAANLVHEFELKRRADDARLTRWTQERDGDELPVESTAEAMTLRARIDDALAELTPNCRAVVILHRRDGMTYDEIAQRLHISSSMVKKYLATGLRHCRSQLRDLI